MSAFLIADVEVHDFERYRESGYYSRVPVIVDKYGGKYRVRGGEIDYMEGDWKPKRLVIIEFPSMEKLKSFYHSDEYAPYLKIRHQVTTSHQVFVEGISTEEAEVLAKGGA